MSENGDAAKSGLGLQTLQSGQLECRQFGLGHAMCAYCTVAGLKGYLNAVVNGVVNGFLKDFLKNLEFQICWI